MRYANDWGLHILNISSTFEFSALPEDPWVRFVEQIHSDPGNDWTITKRNTTLQITALTKNYSIYLVAINATLSTTPSSTWGWLQRLWMLTCQQSSKRCKVNSIHQNDLTSLYLLWIISCKSEPNLPSKILERLSQPGLQNLDAKYHPDLKTVKKMQHSIP